MAVTYYVALPFIRTDDGTAPGEAQECQSEAAAIRRAEGRRSERWRIFGRGRIEESSAMCRKI